MNKPSESGTTRPLRVGVIGCGAIGQLHFWSVLLAHQGSLDAHALRSTARATRVDEPS